MIHSLVPFYLEWLNFYSGYVLAPSNLPISIYLYALITSSCVDFIAYMGLIYLFYVYFPFQ